MTAVSKIFVVVLACFSIAFAGFASVSHSSVAGPNWESHLSEFPDFVFEYTEGEPPTWSAKVRATDETVKSSKVLADVLLACQQKQIQDQKEILDGVQKQIPPLETRLTEIKAANQADTDSMKGKETLLVAELDQLYQDINEARDVGIKKSEEAHATRVQAEYRREDVFRLTNQLAEIRTDYFHQEQRQNRLRDLLYRTQGNIERLEHRQGLLVKKGASIPDEPKQPDDQDAIK